MTLAGPDVKYGQTYTFWVRGVGPGYAYGTFSKKSVCRPLKWCQGEREDMLANHALQPAINATGIKRSLAVDYLCVYVWRNCTHISCTYIIFSFTHVCLPNSDKYIMLCIAYHSLWSTKNTLLIPFLLILTVQFSFYTLKMRPNHISTCVCLYLMHLSTEFIGVKPHFSLFLLLLPPA